MFTLPIAETGFEQILFISMKAHKFLLGLGCSEKYVVSPSFHHHSRHLMFSIRPSQDTILMKLNALAHAGVTLDAVSAKVAINLLSILSSTMSDEERASLLVPDVHSILRSLSEIYLNDVSEHAFLIPVENHFITHDLVDDTLARKFNLARLGLKLVDKNIPGVDMGKNPLTTIRNTLRQYTEQQFITEFVANACDANATKLTLLVNEFCSSASDNPRLLLPALRKFYSRRLLAITSLFIQTTNQDTFWIKPLS